MVVKFRAYVPKAVSVEPMIDEIIKAAEEMNKASLREFGKTVRTWKKKPTFMTKVTVSPKGRSVQALCWTDNEIYKFVDEGTKPHRIEPKTAGGFLRFTVPSRAKTTPNVLGSKAGSKGTNTVYSRGVNHPGTKARNFTKEIKMRREGPNYRLLVAAIKRAAKVSGHGK